MKELLSIRDATKEVIRAATDVVAKCTGNGTNTDEFGFEVDLLASAATDATACDALVAASQQHPQLGLLAKVAASNLARSVHFRVGQLLNLAPELEPALASLHQRVGQLPFGLARDLGKQILDAGGRNSWPLEATLHEVRQSVRSFAEREVAPAAEHIHRNDELIPERFISQMAELGYFGLSVPEQYGGHELGNLAMILTTEELSRASLAAAGSLITRPEILTKALLAGGTPEQKATWLPQLASGAKMVAISVTEPNVGSDVASLSCRATKTVVGGASGYVINGAKAWCTFAGRADVIALLARTDPDPASGARGLSLFIVEKPRFDGHSFATNGAGGGILEGKADRTPGYRGMHSFTLSFDNWFVPEANLVGGEAGLGRGFALQMAGFAAGRLQTGGRACGLAQAALEATCEYITDRKQFGSAIATYQHAQTTIGNMAASLGAARALTYHAAIAMDQDERAAATVAAQAKLFASDAAVEICRQGQLLHGGWGYAEEFAISRYVIDSQVLPIFEGVRPILALKVIGRALLAQG